MLSEVEISLEFFLELSASMRSTLLANEVKLANVSSNYQQVFRSVAY